METQLAERYLRNSLCPFGLYLVGWFCCAQWDDEDPRKKRTLKLGLPDTRARFEDQAKKLSSGVRILKAYVLDAALR
jgi:hypothetical protein